MYLQEMHDARARHPSRPPASLSSHIMYDRHALNSVRQACTYCHAHTPPSRYLLHMRRNQSVVHFGRHSVICIVIAAQTHPTQLRILHVLGDDIVPRKALRMRKPRQRSKRTRRRLSLCVLREKPDQSGVSCWLLTAFLEGVGLPEQRSDAELAPRVRQAGCRSSARITSRIVTQCDTGMWMHCDRTRVKGGIEIWTTRRG